MNSLNYISFPGLGIEPFAINPVAFEVFGHPVMWYGVIICTGMIFAFIYALSRAKYEKIKSDDIIDLGIFLIIFGVLGARLYYILFKLDSFIVKGNLGKTLLNMVSVWNGGLAIYGAVIAGFVTIIVVSRIKRIRTSTLLDVVAPAVMIGQIVGRWGNFTNAEAYGGETSLAWRMGILKSSNGGETFYSEMYVHPTFLYESLWNLIGFILIAFFYKKKKFNGQVFLFYITWYGFGRMFIEGLRTDSLMLGNIRISQIVGGLTFAVGLVLMLVNLKKASDFRKTHAESLSAENADGTFALLNNNSTKSESSADDGDTCADEATCEKTNEADIKSEATDDGEDN